jgi:hypothetical protein
LLFNPDTPYFNLIIREINVTGILPILCVGSEGNGNLEVPVHFIEGKLSYTVKEMGKKRQMNILYTENLPV